jgi:Reverse transcriptase (RNA-dependent DNA polymerase)
VGATPAGVITAQEGALAHSDDDDNEDGNERAQQAAHQGAGGEDTGASSTFATRSSGRTRREPDRFIPEGCFKAKTLSDDEPKDEKEALSGPDSEFWRQAINEEYTSLIENRSWDLAELPEGKTPIDCKWVFKIKRDARGEIERYKARLVAKGYTQKAGIDYDEVYAPVSKYTTLRAFLAHVAAEDLELHQLDIKTAFLNGDLEEEIYMRQPPLYGQGGPRTVCKLLRSLYGLRQAPRAWHTRLKSALEELGFVASEADAALFILKLDTGTVYLLVYVDDLLCAAKTIGEVKRIFKLIGATFEARDLGEATYFLHMEIKRDRSARTLFLSQERYALDLITKFNMDSAHPRALPMSTGTKLTRHGENKCDTPYYGMLIGSLLYLAVCTRPDIAYAVGALARYMSDPLQEHWELAKGLLRYLRGTTAFGIKFGPSSGLRGFCDSDYAGDIDTRRSTTGYAFIYHGGAIAYGVKLQPTVAVSTTETEYMAAGVAAKEALSIRKLLISLGTDLRGTPIKIYCDNEGAIKLLKHPIASVRTKHIDVIHHFARERVDRKEIKYIGCSTADNVADCLTKPLPQQKFELCRKLMGVTSG